MPVCIVYIVLLTLSVVSSSGVLRGILLYSTAFILGGFPSPKTEVPPSLTDHLCKVHTVFGSGKSGIIECRNQDNEKFQLLLTSRIPLQEGATYRISGDVKRITPSSLPQSFSFEQYLVDKGISYAVNLKYPKDIALAKEPSFLVSAPMKIRQYMQDIWKKKVTQEHAALLSAIVLGEKSSLHQKQKEQFRSVGIVHLMAVSGMHLMVVFSSCIILLTWATSNTYKLKIVVHVLALSASLCYAWICGFKPSAVRACILLIFWVYHYHTRKVLPSQYFLFLCAILVLAVDPSALKDIGFQLSYLATFAILFTLYRTTKILQRFTHKISQYITGSLLISLCVQMLLLPLLLYHFGEISLWFWLYSIPASILVYGVLIGGILLCIPLPFLQDIIGVVVEYLLYMLEVILDTNAWLPVHFYSVPKPLTIIETFILLAAGILMLYAYKHKKRQSLWVSLSLYIVVFGATLPLRTTDPVYGLYHTKYTTGIIEEQADTVLYHNLRAQPLGANRRRIELWSTKTLKKSVEVTNTYYAKKGIYQITPCNKSSEIEGQNLTLHLQFEHRKHFPLAEQHPWKEADSTLCFSRSLPSSQSLPFGFYPLQVFDTIYISQ